MNQLTTQQAIGNLQAILRMPTVRLSYDEMIAAQQSLEVLQAATAPKPEPEQEISEAE